ncbi:hypothetical protein HYV81_02065 [Candidatus Woesearchaeota archaeon]|nr:hypothetical protein [Candidatus Woesearchaeota archaeon]
MQTLKFYPLDVTYRIENSLPVIHLFAKTIDGRHVCIIDDTFRPYFWVIPKYENIMEVKGKLQRLEIPKGEQVVKVAKVEQHEKNFLGEAIVALKVFLNLPSDVPLLRDIVRQWDMVTSINEYDILFARRYLIDKKIIPLSLTEAKGEFIESQDSSGIPCFKAAEVKPSSEHSAQDLKILAFDIETYNPLGKHVVAEKHPIVMLALYGDTLKKVITWKKFRTDDESIEFVDSEAQLIDRFVHHVKSYAPDILAGYYSDGFDLPYLMARAKALGIRLDLGMDSSEIDLDKGMNRSARITGLTHIDIFRYIAKILGRTMEAESFTLQKVALELLGEGKHAANIEQLASAWDDGTDKLEAFCQYNLQDALLTFKLTQKMLPNLSEMVKIVGLPLHDINRMGYSQLVEWYLLARSSEFNELNPNKPDDSTIDFRRQMSYTGGFVYEPEPGLYNDIIVFDFRSLYPSLISSHNISPATVRCDCCEGLAKLTPLDGKRKATWFCTRRKGFIPAIIEELITRRLRLKAALAASGKSPFLEAQSNSLKLLANAFYGYLGFPYARWYSMESAEATTAWGRFYIQQVIGKAAQAGFKVIYSDTDSVFLALDGRTKEDALQFCAAVNIELPGVMELEFEGYYPAGIFVSAKAGDIGAKKRYALLSEKGSIKIKGFEAIRKNSSLIAREVQETVLNIILKDRNPAEAVRYVKAVIKDLKDKKVPIEKVILNTQLQKRIDTYESVSPHVAVAQKMLAAGISIRPGSNIQFVIAEDTHNSKEKLRDKARLPDEVNEKDYDADYYIRHQVIPSIERILNVFGYTKDVLLENREQSKLASFF